MDHVVREGVSSERLSVRESEVERDSDVEAVGSIDFVKDMDLETVLETNSQSDALTMVKAV